jgi:hypothetical protein
MKKSLDPKTDGVGYDVFERISPACEEAIGHDALKFACMSMT